MTHSTVNVEAENEGSLDGTIHTIDITSLDSAGAETYNPGDEVGLEDPGRYGVSVRGQEDGSLLISWDHINEQLTVNEVVDTGDGTGGVSGVAAGTAVGQVVLHVKGA